MDKHVLYFHEIDKKDLPSVGGKGANLGEMTKAGFPVPQGFCVTTFAYRAFVETSQEMERLFQQLDQLHPDALDEIRVVGQCIRKHLQSIPMPEEIRTAILQALQQTGDGKSYAVRSSATAEDLPTASFAGQQDTYLNVLGEEQLLQAIQNCWASLFTDRAIVYRTKNGFDHRSVLLSVVVQEMIFPDVSGILFTADPITGHRNTVSIDASFGLGEALVSGLVSADLYQVRSGRIVTKKISKKKIAIYSLPEGGTVTEDLPEDKQEVQSLSDQKILELAALGQQIEAHYGSEQDVEWCLAEGRFYVVQSRPITSLYPVPKIEDDHLHVLFSFGHQQMMLDAMKPLGMSFWRTLLPFGKTNPVHESNVILPAGSHLFLDLTELLQLRPAQMLLPKALAGIDERISSAVAEVMERSGFLREPKAGVKRKTYQTVRPLAWNLFKNLLIRDHSHRVEQINDFMERLVAESEQFVNGSSGPERIKRIQENLSRLVPAMLANVLHYILPGMLTFKAIESLSARWLNDPHAIHVLNKSLPGNVTSEMGLQIGDLADAARENQALIEYLQHAEDRTFFEGLRQVPGSERFQQQVERFMDRYGMRCPGEIDVTTPRWSEAPTMLVAPLIGHIRSVEFGEHREKFARGAEEAAQAADEMLSQLRFAKKKVMARLIHVYRNAMGLREHPKYTIIRHFGIYKKAILEEARPFVAKGVLKREDDVFYLTLPELLTLVENRFAGDVADIIESRKKQFALDQKLTPPRVMTSEGEVLTGKRRDVEAPEGAFVGTPVSAGVVEGYARVVLRPEEAKLNPGEILIAPFTDPGWTPLFHSAKGLVMEIGGLMTHGAVVAREYGIPAVVGIDNATEIIRDGDYIRIDGTQGFVMHVEKA